MQRQNVLVFVEITDFSRRNGWTADSVAIVDGADPRTSRIVCRTRIRHHWKTHNQKRYPTGSVIFQNLMRLCLETMTLSGRLSGRRVQVFEDSPLFDVLWQRQQLGDQVLAWMQTAEADDVVAAVELLSEVTGVRVTAYRLNRPALGRELLACAEAASLAELVAFVSLLRAASSSPSSAAA